jgi:hypothetical protein
MGILGQPSAGSTLPAGKAIFARLVAEQGSRQRPGKPLFADAFGTGEEERVMQRGARGE